MPIEHINGGTARLAGSRILHEGPSHEVSNFMTQVSATPPSDRLDPLRTFVESGFFQAFILFVIVVNAIILGLATSDAIMESVGSWISSIDTICLLIFIVEMFLKLFVYRHRYFKDGWNVFDFLIISISVPSLLGFDFLGNISILRAARILRAMRIMSIVPQMRQIVTALASALPGMASVIVVLLLLFYIAAVMATQSFGSPDSTDAEVMRDLPEWFGSVGKSLYTLFQIMTLESWSHGIVRIVMREYPLAWAFFVPFIVITSFMVLNLFIALIVTSMQNVYEEQHSEKKDSIEDSFELQRKLFREEIATLSRQVAELRDDLLTQRDTTDDTTERS